jgi:hypothetical protein
MSSPLPDVRATARPSGLIDTIQAGFNAVNRNIWLLFLPLAVDIALWLGPQPTAEPLAERWLNQLTPPPGASSTLTRAIEDERRSLLQLLQRDPEAKSNNFIAVMMVPVVHNLALFIVVPAIGIPSFQANAGFVGAGAPLSVSSLGAALGLVAVFTVAGLCLSALFYGMLGQAVRDGTTTPRRFAGDFLPILLWTTAFFVLVWIVLSTIAAPVGMLLLVMGTATPTLGALMLPIILGVLLWGLVYLFFAPYAIVVDCVPPLAAFRQSIQVVRHNLWSTLAFIALYGTIFFGLLILWGEIAANLRLPGSAIAILGHIYISSGLAAASMTYYKERYERLT